MSSSSTVPVRVYMDANATTPVTPEVLEAMLPFFSGAFGNASSIHLDGQQARTAVDHARSVLARFFNCRDAEVVFNSGGTEGDNTALFGLLRPGDHLVTTAIEHSAILEPARRLAERGVQVTFLPPDTDGLISAAQVQTALQPNTRLVSVMLANNETGVLQPVEEIGEVCRTAGVLFHVDAVQGAGKIPFDVQRFGCHLLSISAHKMYGPKGVGALYVRRGTPVESLILGGSHERRHRAGTVNTPGIVGLGRAAELAQQALASGVMDRVARLRDRLEAGILALPGTTANGARAPRVANTTNISFDRLEGEALVIALDLKGIAVSGGSACHSGATEPSHVLMAMGLDRPRALASLRFSLLKTATEADVDRVLAILPEAVQRLRALSPAEAGTLA